MFSPATRAVAYLLAGLLLRLLEAILANGADLPAETVARLKQTIETLAHDLRRLAETGEAPAKRQRSARRPARLRSTSRVRRAQRHQPVPRLLCTRPRLHPPPKISSAQQPLRTP